MSLLTNPRITNLFVGRRSDGDLFQAEITLCGYIYKRTGFESLGEAYHWARSRVALHFPAMPL